MSTENGPSTTAPDPKMITDQLRREIRELEDDTQPLSDEMTDNERWAETHLGGLPISYSPVVASAVDALLRSRPLTEVGSGPAVGSPAANARPTRPLDRRAHGEGIVSDGAHLGVSAKRALGTILGGQGQPEADERMTVENMREWLLGAPPAGHPTPPQTYDECARRVAGEILRWALTNPERYSHTPAESEIGRPGLYHVLKAEGIPLEDLGISGFQWGWAYNAARRCLELPPVANPAIVTIDTEPAS